jgi:cytoskeleton protein RodZ
MGEFGDNLRRERELRGITLAEISESTKISKRWLKALEDEEFETLPGGVFNRGFVRSYAHFLGINEEEAVADYITASNEQQQPADKFPLEIHEKPNASTVKPKLSLVPVVLGVMALVLALGGWAYWIKHKSTEPAAAGQGSGTVASSASAATQSSFSSGPQLPATPDVKAPSMSKPAQTTEPPLGPAPDKALSASTPSQDNAPNATDVKQTGSKEPANQIRAFSVVIKAKENSWISIAADGKPFWEGILNANNERSVTAGKELVLKTGNAAGIDVSYNGKALGTLGKDKQVRTLTFNTAGLQQ